MRHPPRLVATLAPITCLLGVALADPRPASLLLEWNAPEGCPDGADVESQIERLLGGQPQLAGSEPLRARATVIHDDAWRVSLETGSGAKARRRSLQADSCRGLADATALIIALMIDPAAVAAHSAPSGSAAPSSSVADPPAPPAPVLSAGVVARDEAPPPPDLATWRGHFFVSALGVSDVGVLPRPGLALGGAMGLRWDNFRFTTSFVYSLEQQTARSASLTSAGGTFRMMWSALAQCYALGFARFEAGPCTGLELGSMQGEGFGVDWETRGRALWVAGDAGGFFRWNASGRLAASVRFDAVVPFSRPRFVLDNVGDVFRTAPVAGRATMGLEFSL